MGHDGRAPAPAVTCILCDRARPPEEPGLVRLEQFAELCICAACLAGERDGWVTLDDVC